MKRAPLTIRVKNTSDLPLPKYQTEHAAAMDLLAAVDEPVTLQPGKRAIIPTGLYVEIPEGHEMQIRARSGLAAKHGVCLANGVGTIDADYRGEIGVILINLGDEPFTIERSERIAQAVVARYESVQWEPVEVISETKRGAGGFGSTGGK